MIITYHSHIPYVGYANLSRYFQAYVILYSFDIVLDKRQV